MKWYNWVNKSVWNSMMEYLLLRWSNWSLMIDRMHHTRSKNWMQLGRIRRRPIDYIIGISCARLWRVWGWVSIMQTKAKYWISTPGPFSKSYSFYTLSIYNAESPYHPILSRKVWPSIWVKSPRNCSMMLTIYSNSLWYRYRRISRLLLNKHLICWMRKGSIYHIWWLKGSKIRLIVFLGWWEILQWICRRLLLVFFQVGENKV